MSRDIDFRPLSPGARAQFFLNSRRTPLAAALEKARERSNVRAWESEGGALARRPRTPPA
ncbi:MAG: hypothetical protein ABI789_09650 [Usitatibacter sp.]